MSGSSNYEPLATIGAQDLINGIEFTCAGFLRVKGRRDKVFDRLGPVGSLLGRAIKWTLQYVVVSRGCLYIFSSETATKPNKAFTLGMYNSVKRTTDETGKVKTTFALLPHETYQLETGAESFFFAVPCDKDRVKWMFHVKAETMKANGNSSQHAEPRGIPDEGIYADIEKPVKEPPKSGSGYTLERNNSNFQPDEDEEEDDDNDDLELYDTIDENQVGVRLSANQINAKMAKPKPDKKAPKPVAQTEENKPASNTTHSYVNQKEKGARPTIAAKPGSKTLPKASWYFDAGGRDEALEALKEKQKDGTFLVRKSRNDDGNILSVVLAGEVKEFRIQKIGSTFSLDKIEKFTSMEEMLMSYKSKSLPKKDMSLAKAIYEA